MATRLMIQLASNTVMAVATDSHRTSPHTSSDILTHFPLSVKSFHFHKSFSDIHLICLLSEFFQKSKKMRDKLMKMVYNILQATSYKELQTI